MLIAGDQPVVKTSHSFMNTDPRLPGRRPAKLVRVRDVVALIGRAPLFKFNRNLTAMQICDKIEQLEQADRVRWTTTDVEGVAGETSHVLLRQQERIHKIIDEENVAYLLAVARSEEHTSELQSH